MKKFVTVAAAALVVSSAAFAQQKPQLNFIPVNQQQSPQGAMLPGASCNGAGGTNCPGALPDNDPAGITSTFTLADCDIVEDVNIGVQATHTWVGDLIVEVTSPGGTTVSLMDQPGVPAGTFGCNNNNAALVFDDDGAMVVEDVCNATTDDPWIVDGSSWAPIGSLASINGEDGNGTWTLFISDNAAGDTGQLDDWTVDATCGTNLPPYVRPAPIPAVAPLGLLFMGTALAGVGIAAVRRRKKS